MSQPAATDDRIRVALCGAHGRMGTRIRRVIEGIRRFRIAQIVDQRRESAGASTDDTSIDVVVDFSSNSGTQAAAHCAVTHQAALVVGTTGLSDDTQACLHDAARTVPVLIAPNMSLGVAVLHRLARMAAQTLGDDFDVDIVEHHHNTKRDAPSGTAISLAQIIGEAGNDVPVDRIHAIRAGDLVGEHTIHFSGPDERLSITHCAGSRDLFAKGAMRLAAWLVGRQPGLYTVEQTLEA